MLTWIVSMTTDLICLRQKKGAFYIFAVVYLDFSLRKTNKLPNLKTD